MLKVKPQTGILFIAFFHLKGVFYLIPLPKKLFFHTLEILIQELLSSLSSSE